MQPRVPEIYPHTLWPDTYRNTRFIEAISHTPDVLENAFDEVPPPNSLGDPLFSQTLRLSSPQLWQRSRNDWDPNWRDHSSPSSSSVEPWLTTPYPSTPSEARTCSCLSSRSKRAGRVASQPPTSNTNRYGTCLLYTSPSPRDENGYLVCRLLLE